MPVILLIITIFTFGMLSLSAQDANDDADIYMDKSSPDLVKVSESLNNIGICYYLMNNYREAIPWFEEALEMALEQGNKELLASIYNNMGSVYLNLQRTDDAVSYHQQALELQQLIDELNIIFTAFDKIIQDHHCERIKTIGDSYMAVCGLP
ncbi:MAG: tetratricopeptide repeat protein, partial [Bacteroidales bacterium]|nr:tetratricopeptide repeat protein [Bacteroidales bacterium]